MGEGIRLLIALVDFEGIGEVISWVDTAIKSTGKVKDLQELYMATVEQKTKMLSTTTVPVSTEEGLLLTRTINFNKAVQKWIDFEILPLLIDVMENKNAMTSFFTHSLVNLKTGLLVEKNNNSLEGIPSQLSTLKNVHSSLSKNADRLEDLIEEIKLQFASHFQATKIYSDADFLDVSFQSSLSQFATEKTNLFSRLQKQWKKRFAKFNSKYESSLRFQSQNKLERATACIHYRTLKEENSHYDTLFLNKNFIGDLFLLPRSRTGKKSVGSNRTVEERI